MLSSFFETIEDPKTPLLGPNIWISKKCGFVLPKSSVQRFFWMLYHSAGAFFVISQFVELYVIRSDLDLVLTNLNISMLSTICVMKGWSFFIYQRNWMELIEYITEADIFERKTENPVRLNILKKYTKYSRKVTFFYWILVLVTSFVSFSAPVVQYISHRIAISSSNEGSSNNETETFTEPFLFPHMFSSWMPFDKYNWPGNWFTVIWHMACCYYGSGSMSSFDSMVMVFMVFFSGKLELFRERCKELFGKNGDQISDEEATAIIGELHQIHVNVLKYSRLFNALLSPIMFLYMVLCSFLLCANGYRITSTTSIVQKLLLAEYFMFFISQLFVFCWHSNDVFVKYQSVSIGPYESEWWAVKTVKQRKNIHLLAGQLHVMTVFTAGPFTNLTLATFITILKGAYSYYTLLSK